MLGVKGRCVIPAQAGIQKKQLDSHFRGNDIQGGACVIPAQAGIQKKQMDSRFRGNDTPWGPRVFPAQAGIQILRLSPPWERPAVPKAPPGEILCWESRGFLGKMEFRVVHGEAPWDEGG